MSNSVLFTLNTNKKSRNGFTLAEVLLTLGIIGVVAAMTIPTLMSNTNSAKFRTQFKKAVSTLSQAGIMSQALVDFDYAANSNSTVSCTINADPDNRDYSFCAIFNKTLKGHSLSTTPPRSNYELPTQPYQIENPMYLTLADGTLVVFDSKAAGCRKAISEDITALPVACGAYVDVNGASMPNKVVSCTDVETDGTACSRGRCPSPAPAQPQETFQTGTCSVPKDSAHLTDIFPVVFHDTTVEPASAAARYILTTSK